MKNFKKKINFMLNEEHEAIGGLYFLSVNILMSFILVICLHLSWSSSVIAMADNLAYIVSINCTVHNYLSNEAPYTRINPSIKINKGGTYNPLYEFNKMARDSGIMKSPATRIEVKWNGRRTQIQVGGFETVLGDMITPHVQNSTIENH